MSRFIVITITCILIAILSACNAAPQIPRKFPVSGVPYPADYRTTFTHYATVERSDGKSRDLYINPEALRRYTFTRALPEGTIITIEGYNAATDENGDYLVDEHGYYVRDTPLEMVHVIEKRADWRNADFVSEVRAGRWNFGTFDFVSRQAFDEDTVACFNCHNGTPGTDFLQARDLLDRYAVSQLVQYLYCDLPDRLAC